ncbi:hypothetical protein C8R45DRAFT_931811 [Mycena sanguinolenta]|nr:hypothetical protein C8R45DRAFT_931811 [Mycena sanguinolenta]
MSEMPGNIRVRPALAKIARIRRLLFGAIPKGNWVTPERFLGPQGRGGHHSEIDAITCFKAWCSGFPYKGEERGQMWKDLRKMWADDPTLPFPNVALGDWNFVEDPRDRNSGTTETMPESFKILKHMWRLQDGWGTTFPDTRDYTCCQIRVDKETKETHISYSRLDRFYVVNREFDRYRGWDIKHCAVKSDHELVLTEITCRPDQKPGPGRWSLPHYLLKSRAFMRKVQALGAQLLRDLERLDLSDRDEEENIQTLWAKFTLDVVEWGKHCS